MTRIQLENELITVTESLGVLKTLLNDVSVRPYITLIKVDTYYSEYKQKLVETKTKIVLAKNKIIYCYES